MQLLNTIFKSCDRTLSMKLSAQDIQHFINLHLSQKQPRTPACKIFVSLFAGLAQQKLTGERGSYIDHLQFSDFMMVVMPAAKFKLRYQTLFKNMQPVYDLQRQQVSSGKTLQIIATILDLWIEFIHQLGQMQLGMACQELWAAIAGKKKQWTQSDLFSYLLNLPVIYSTSDTENIFRCLQMDKTAIQADIEDFMAIVSLATKQSAPPKPRQKKSRRSSVNSQQKSHRSSIRSHKSLPSNHKPAHKPLSRKSSTASNQAPSRASLTSQGAQPPATVYDRRVSRDLLNTRVARAGPSGVTPQERQNSVESLLYVESSTENESPLKKSLPKRNEQSYKRHILRSDTTSSNDGDDYRQGFISKTQHGQELKSGFVDLRSSKNQTINLQQSQRLKQYQVPTTGYQTTTRYS